MAATPTKDELIESFQRFADAIDKYPPARQDCLEDDEYTVGPWIYRKEFGSWNEAVIAAGYDPNKRDNITNEELLEELSKVADEFGCAPKKRHMKEAEDTFSVSTYNRRFGSWNEALAEIGYDPNKEYAIPDSDLIAELQQITDEFGRPPKYEEMEEREDAYHPETYASSFGTFNEAKRAAGLERQNIKNVSEEFMLEKLEMIKEDLGRDPKYDDLFDYPTVPCPYTYEQRFGTFNDAKREAGMEVTVESRVSREDLKAELNRVKNEFGRTPSVNEFREMDGVYGVTTYARKFGSWIEALEAAGIDPIDWSGENHPAYKGGTDGYLYYGPEWPRQRKKALERDGYECVDCGMTNEDHNSKYGNNLHVHHRKPLRDYIDSEESTRRNANELDNLITLCHKCHRKWESVPVQIDIR
jgi:hypothetical protein